MINKLIISYNNYLGLVIRKTAKLLAQQKK
jgi:hypothetical protein